MKQGKRGVENQQFVLELLKYETPSIAEFVSWEWLQNIISRYLAWKINRKLKRYNMRCTREEWLKSLGKK